MNDLINITISKENYFESNKPTLFKPLKEIFKNIIVDIKLSNDNVKDKQFEYRYQQIYLKLKDGSILYINNYKTYKRGAIIDDTYKISVFKNNTWKYLPFNNTKYEKSFINDLHNKLENILKNIVLDEQKLYSNISIKIKIVD